MLGVHTLETSTQLVLGAKNLCGVQLKNFILHVFSQSQIDLPAFAADWFVVLGTRGMCRKCFVVTGRAAGILHVDL